MAAHVDDLLADLHTVEPRHGQRFFAAGADHHIAEGAEEQVLRHANSRLFQLMQQDHRACVVGADDRVIVAANLQKALTGGIHQSVGARIVKHILLAAFVVGEECVLFDHVCGGIGADGKQGNAIFLIAAQIFNELIGCLAIVHVDVTCVAIAVTGGAADDQRFHTESRKDGSDLLCPDA